ncbi:hypothetical protein HC891_05980, partial [Candidatus Gracilibacteria bacterium]|nr:hypothetical protein [Candidatus Gracilibacteria bacterium]
MSSTASLPYQLDHMLLGARSPLLAHFARYNPGALIEVMHTFGGSVDADRLQMLASDPNTPIAALIYLAGIYPAEFCANPVLPLLLLEDPGLPAKFEPISLGRLLAYADIPRDLLHDFARFAAPDQALAARLHVGLAGEADVTRHDELHVAIEQISVIPDDDLLILLLQLQLVPDWLAQRAERRSKSVITAPSPLVTPPALHHLADPQADSGALLDAFGSEDPAVRATIAANPALSAAQLLELKQREDNTDVDYSVYRALATNPNASDELLCALAADRTALNTIVRRALVHNPATPAAALALLADEWLAPDIQLVLAGHLNLNPSLHEAIAAAAIERAFGSNDAFYRAIALAQPQPTRDELEQSARSPFWIERLAVADNPAIPADLRQLLTDDGNRFVRAAARHNSCRRIRTQEAEFSSSSTSQCIHYRANRSF